VACFFSRHRRWRPDYFLKEIRMVFRPSLFTRSLLTAAALTLALPLFAQDAKPLTLRVRGTIEKSDGSTLTVRTRENTMAQIVITEKTVFTGVKKLQMADIGANAYIGVAGRPLAGGNVDALEVLVFPEAARGTGEGQQDWDLLPGSSMTNATVTATVASASGSDLEVSFKGKKVNIKVGPDTPIVTFATATRMEAMAGLYVLVFAARDASGTLTANRVVLETNGVKPPM
jgi:hypothetical protein